jgi:hypothetical protein
MNIVLIERLFKGRTEKPGWASQFRQIAKRNNRLEQKDGWDADSICLTGGGIFGDGGACRPCG